VDHVGCRYEVPSREEADKCVAKLNTAGLWAYVIDEPTERSVRHWAKECGYSVHKNRKRKNVPNSENHGEYMLVNVNVARNCVVLGERYDASLRDIEEYLRSPASQKQLVERKLDRVTWEVIWWKMSLETMAMDDCTSQKQSVELQILERATWKMIWGKSSLATMAMDDCKRSSAPTDPNDAIIFHVNNLMRQIPGDKAGAVYFLRQRTDGSSQEAWHESFLKLLGELEARATIALEYLQRG